MGVKRSTLTTVLVIMLCSCNYCGYRWFQSDRHGLCNKLRYIAFSSTVLVNNVNAIVFTYMHSTILTHIPTIDVYYRLRLPHEFQPDDSGVPLNTGPDSNPFTPLEQLVCADQESEFANLCE
jgi:hypothetical protein